VTPLFKLWLLRFPVWTAHFGSTPELKHALAVIMQQQASFRPRITRTVCCLHGCIIEEAAGLHRTSESSDWIPHRIHSMVVTATAAASWRAFIYNLSHQNLINNIR